MFMVVIIAEDSVVANLVVLKFGFILIGSSHEFLAFRCHFILLSWLKKLHKMTGYRFLRLPRKNLRWMLFITWRIVQSFVKLKVVMSVLTLGNIFFQGIYITMWGNGTCTKGGIRSIYARSSKFTCWSEGSQGRFNFFFKLFNIWEAQISMLWLKPPKVQGLCDFSVLLFVISKDMNVASAAYYGG